MRAFADPALAEAPSLGEPENAALLLVSTATDAPLCWLRAGDVTSAVLLAATRAGLASSPLTQPLEVADTRTFIRDQLAATPRRPLAEVMGAAGEM
jgi:hypothetical protein